MHALLRDHVSVTVACMDRERFAPVPTEFCGHHGWDANGWPSEASMEALHFGEMHEPMVERADSATLREVSDESSD